MILSMKNKYIVRPRISEKKFREILKYFTEDICKTAFQIKVNLRLKSKWNKNGDFSL